VCGFLGCYKYAFHFCRKTDNEFAMCFITKSHACAGSYLIVYMYHITMTEPRIQLAFRNKKKITIDKEHVFCDLWSSTFFLSTSKSNKSRRVTKKECRQSKISCMGSIQNLKKYTKIWANFSNICRSVY